MAIDTEDLRLKIKQKELEIKKRKLLTAIDHHDVNIMRCEIDLERLKSEKEKSQAALEELLKEEKQQAKLPNGLKELPASSGEDK